MSDSVADTTFTILLLGLALIGTILVKALVGRSVVPALIGFIILGFLFRIADTHWNLFSEQSDCIFTFLSKVGIIALLFRIGLESQLTRLFEQLRRASVIWISGLFVSGFLGYIIAFYGFGLEMIPSLFVGVAMTATSVGVPVGVWREANALRSKKGSLLIDVAELDNISGVGLMVILFAIAPLLRQEFNQDITAVLVREMGLVIIKFLIFAGVCFLFSRYLEERITGFMRKWVSSSNVLLISFGFGFIIAAIAGMAGFSVAIGAFFAGLAFSRDPGKVKMDTSFDTLFEMFSPFFFIGIGLSISPDSIFDVAGIGFVFFIIAALGKFLGHGIPAWISGGISGLLLIGVSMIPRAEITMIIMEHGLNLGSWAVPDHVFTTMVFIVLLTCLTAPLGVRLLLEKWPQTETSK
jgi:Kef-type K+ transport system membrane component KefB